MLYEMHVGTFTPEGTWDAALRELPALADLGVSAIELMPVADFPGRFGWSYDSVNWFAPTRLYGPPDAMRRFVDQAHALGMGVILDVVYNHFGPVGAYLTKFTKDYLSDRYWTEWGPALNFDGPNSDPVREYVLASVTHWIEEYHLDGFRIDATQAFFDASPEHILTAIARRARRAAGGRHLFLIGENEPQRSHLARPVARGGIGLDALWNEDFHHVALLAASGRAEGYYADYHGSPQEWISLLKRGFLYQGQRDIRQGKARGTPALDLEASSFVNYLQNHDQVANSIRGDRFHTLTSPGRYRAITALFLLGSVHVMLFQGQEFAASSPFLYFADFGAELAGATFEGRKQFLKQFPSLNDPEAQAVLADPTDPETFQRSKLDPSERHRQETALALHGDLLRLRREDSVFVTRPGGLDGAVLGPEALALRFFGHGGDDRLMLVNLGRSLLFKPISEPLLAPPEARCWAMLWSSESPRYGGGGTPAIPNQDGWFLPGHSAVVLRGEPEEGRSP